MKKISLNQKGFSPIYILLIVIVVGVVGFAGWYVWQTQNKNNNKVDLPASSQSQTDPQTVKQTAKIYFSDNNKLYSINPSDNKKEEIDSPVASQSGATGYGSNSALMSPDMLKVVYIKDNQIWLKEDGKQTIQIKQPKPTKSESYYSWYISAWSSDSKNFTYAITFGCGMGGPGCDESDEDKNITGIYWYSLASRKSTKLPIARSDLWLPKSNKIVFFNNANNFSHLNTYDVISGETKTLSKVGWAGLEPQIAFSDDGEKMIYVYGTPDANSSKIIIANTDNTNQKIQKEGGWAEYNWPRFNKDSSTDYIYSHSESLTCPSGTGGCPKMFLYSVLGGKTTKVAEIINHITGFFYNKNEVIVIRGYVYDEAKARTLSLINISNKNIKDLQEGGSLLDSKMYWQ